MSQSPIALYLFHGPVLTKCYFKVGLGVSAFQSRYTMRLANIRQALGVENNWHASCLFFFFVGTLNTAVFS